MTSNALKSRQEGFVLIVVLAAVLLLSALLFGFSSTARMRLQAAESFYRAEQAWSSARAGLHIAIAAIAEANDLCADPRFATFATGENTFAVADGSCSVAVIDESGLLNVNSLKDENGRLNRSRIDQLLRLIDLLNRRHKGTERIGYGIVPALIDWIDADDEVTSLPFVERESLGAEESYYRTCDPPYHCRNLPLETIDELEWVKGITPKALRRLRNVLTCVGGDKININAAPALVLQCLSEEMDPALVEMIMEHRRLRPFESVSDLRNVPGMTDNIYQSIRRTVTVRPTQRWYRVVSQGNSDSRSTLVEAVLRRNTQAGNVDIILYREM